MRVTLNRNATQAEAILQPKNWERKTRRSKEKTGNAQTVLFSHSGTPIYVCSMQGNSSTNTWPASHYLSLQASTISLPARTVSLPASSLTSSAVLSLFCLALKNIWLSNTVSSTPEFCITNRCPTSWSSLEISIYISGQNTNSDTKLQTCRLSPSPSSVVVTHCLTINHDRTWSQPFNYTCKLFIARFNSQQFNKRECDMHCEHAWLIKSHSAHHYNLIYHQQNSERCV